ncbi:MAG TPA: TetR/AcrR family transcriptional regulator [Vineibacter sp.]|nr:TetR/AcrR family transcriptional regulator [Vineibacter sp.]
MSSRPSGTAPDGRETPPAEAIEAAAFDLFARQGFQVTTVRDVMHACGLTQGALYNHFSSKDELLATIIRSTQAGLERELAAAVAEAGDAPAAQLQAFVRAYTLRHARRRVEAIVANREWEWLDASRRQEIRASRRRVRDTVIRILERGHAGGAFAALRPGGRDDLKIVAMAILNQCTYVAYWFNVAHNGWRADDVAELHAELALRLVGAAQAGAARSDRSAKAAE